MFRIEIRKKTGKKGTFVHILHKIKRLRFSDLFERNNLHKTALNHRQEILLRCKSAYIRAQTDFESIDIHEKRLYYLIIVNDNIKYVEVSFLIKILYASYDCNNSF